MLDPLLYRWGVPPVVIRCVHWTMQMGVLLTWIMAQSTVIVMVKFDKYKHKENKWITHGILRSIEHRDELYKELSCTVRTSDRDLILKNKLNTSNKMLKKKNTGSKNVDNNRSNVRKTWNTINEILCKTKQKRHGLKSIISNGKKINDPIEIVNQFNDFFINVEPNLIKNVAQPINETYRKYLNKSTLT